MQWLISAKHCLFQAFDSQISLVNILYACHIKLILALFPVWTYERGLKHKTKKNKTFSSPSKPVLICCQLAELSYSVHFVQKTSRFVCDESGQMLERSPEGDWKGVKGSWVRAKQNKTIKSFIISHSPVTLLRWWS